MGRINITAQDVQIENDRSAHAEGGNDGCGSRKKVRRGLEDGRPSDDAHISESMYGALGDVLV